MSIDLCSMSAAKIANCISMGELTAEAVMVSYLDRINARAVSYTHLTLPTT